jgi:hypothetical protein
MAISWAVLVVAYGLFWFVGNRARTLSGHSLRTPLDDAIPFVPWTVYLYSWVYTSMFFPVFVLRDRRLFVRTFVGYMFVLGVSLVIYVAYPVSAVGLRPPNRGLDPTVFHEWGVRLTYFLDAPTNLFPSLHLSVALVATMAVFIGRPAYGWIALPIPCFVAVTILTMKQHYVADGVAALVVSAAAWYIAFRPYLRHPPPRAGRAFGWWSVAAYLAFHGVVYGAAFVAWRAGFLPWES